MDVLRVEEAEEMRMPLLVASLLVVGLAVGGLRAQEAPGAPLIVTESLSLEAGATLARPLVVRGRDLVIDGRGATIRGPGVAGDPASFQGIGILVEGGGTITIRNLLVSGFRLGLEARGTAGLLVEGCDFTDNQTDPEAGWNDERVAGGIRLLELGGAVVRDSKARGCWNGIALDGCRDCLIENNDFSGASNTAARLRLSCANVLRGNDLSRGIRVRPGEAHARDSCGLLIESGSDDNLVVGNDIRFGGDGIFVRISSGWVSTGNRFIENDCSHAHNHGVECWSPGNVWIRNKANHCSYGFWMGGSDRTVMIGNEAGFNGRADGHHNAPEKGFGHGGIVFVKGAAQHLLLEGNDCHDNGGPGIVIAGHRTADGLHWPFFDLLIQHNRLERNSRALWLEDGSFVDLRANRRLDNQAEDHLVGLTGLVVADEAAVEVESPWAHLDGPTRVLVGEPARYSAARSGGPAGEELSFRIAVDGSVTAGPEREVVFTEPGRHRVALRVVGAGLADLAWLDVLVSRSTTDSPEIGSEDQSMIWSFVMGADPEDRGRVSFADDHDAVVGQRSIRARVEPYMGRDVALVHAFLDHPLDLRRRHRLVFWVRYRNPNFWGFQGPNPVARLLTTRGFLTFTPVGEKGPRNRLWELPEPEGRAGWTRFAIPLAGGDGWERTVEGEIDLGFIQSLSFQFDSWGGDPFTIWLDGIRCE